MTYHEEIPLTRLIQSAAREETGAREELYASVYDELKSLAQKHALRKAPTSDELQATAIVHEVVLRFEKGKVLKSMPNRRVFFSVAVGQ